MEQFLNVDSVMALITLSAMEIVLGIDNIVFIAIVVGRVEAKARERLRKIGIFLALIIRVGLLFSLSWIMGFTEVLFHFVRDWNGRDLVLFLGGLFLIWKSVVEIHEKIQGDASEQVKPGENVKVRTVSQMGTLIQILLLDIVFSLDSVITAVGMSNQIPIMVVAMTVAMLVMLFSAKWVGEFVMNNPTIKMLALSFLLLIGVLLVAEGTGQHIDKAYVYFAMGFSLGVEWLNMKYRKKRGFKHP